MSAMLSQQYPKPMVHPAYKAGATHKLADGDYQGDPDRYPPVTVSNDVQENYHRAMGYLAVGETLAHVDYSEYPLMLVHPEHVDAVPESTEARKTETGFETYRVPGLPEKFPHVVVNDGEEEKKWTAKGWKRPGKADAAAVETAKASPYDPSRRLEEFPKMVDGVVVDPNQPPLGPIEYPKWVGGQIVNSKAEERAVLASMPMADRPTVPCVICSKPIGADEPSGEGATGRFHLAHFAASSDVAPVQKKRGGRPKGSKNKAKQTSASHTEA